MKTEGNLISDWLDKHGDPEIDRFIEKNLAITEKVRLAMEDKGWKSRDLAKAMGKTPAEVSKWLTGMHNLTLKSIIKLECALGVDLIHCEPVKEYVYMTVLKKQDDLQAKTEDYNEGEEMIEHQIAM